MKISNLTQYVAGIATAVVMLAGCSGGASQPSGLSSLGDRAAVGVHAGHRRSWMGINAKRGDLLYISNSGANDVMVYSYRVGKLKGTLTGFSGPEGECVDKAGDVWIVNTGTAQILEYAHGGTTPIATLNDSVGYPQGCSVDPTTGNLAVTNFYTNPSAGPGNVVIYPNAQGTPVSYADTNIKNFYHCSYDNQGNLYVDGHTPGIGGVFAELPSESSTFTDITLNVVINIPAGIQWDGKYVAVGDASASAIYQFSINGNKGTVVATATLNGLNGMSQFWIQGPKVISPNSSTPTSGGSTDGTAMFWNYPAGGTATKTLSGLTYPGGAVVSKGTKAPR